MRNGCTVLYIDIGLGKRFGNRCSHTHLKTGKQAMTIYLAIGAATFCIGIGIIVVPELAVLDLVFTIIAAVQANSGTRYRYPLTIRLIT